MSEHRYSLCKKMNSKLTCPQCGRHKEFTPYVDKLTGNYLPQKYGRCNRILKCGYHLNPYLDGYVKDMREREKSYQCRQKPLLFKKRVYTPVAKPAVDEVQTTCVIPTDIFNQSLVSGTNNLMAFLTAQFGADAALQAAKRYNIGTSNYWPGATVFWQVSKMGQIKGGKIMLYNADTGKRVKQPFNHCTWIHTVHKLANYKLQQCFFGEHLLYGSIQPVAIVESEKTAVIASLYYPQYIWLACGSLTGLTVDKCRILIRRIVCLYPDVKAYTLWCNKANAITTALKIQPFKVNNMLERIATEAERSQGLDIADYLLRFTPHEFGEQTMFNAFAAWQAKLPQGGVFEYDRERVRITVFKNGK